MPCGDVPADRRGAARRADADDRAGDRVGRRYGNAERGGQEQRDGPAGFRADAVHRRELRDPGSHRLDDPPAAAQRAERHRRLTAKHDPERRRGSRPWDAIAANEQRRDDAHGLLRVVAAVTERVERRPRRTAAAGRCRRRAPASCATQPRRPRAPTAARARSRAAARER